MSTYLAANDGANFIIRGRWSARDVRVAIAKATRAVEVEACRSNSRTGHGGIMHWTTQSSWTCYAEHNKIKTETYWSEGLGKNRFFNWFEFFIFVMLIWYWFFSCKHLTCNHMYVSKCPPWSPPYYHGIKSTNHLIEFDSWFDFRNLNQIKTSE